MLFDDGKRRVDFVLIRATTVDEQKVHKRLVFETNLIRFGVELELDENAEDDDERYRYTKLHLTRPVLKHMAEFMQMKLPIQEYDIDTPDSVFPYIRPHCLTDNLDLIPTRLNYFVAPFTQQRLDMFITVNNEVFFSTGQRSQMMYEILQRTSFDEERDDMFGLDRLLHQNIYTAAFPLHDGPYTIPKNTLHLCKRQLLYETWARPGQWHCYQPLDDIRKYFGVKIGIYFAWLDFYTWMLIPASVVGVLVFVYGLATFTSSTPAAEICDENGAGNLTMCPRCGVFCTYWRLRDSCSVARFSSVFDNKGTVFFACFMAVWSRVFIELWKRKQTELRHDWHVTSYKKDGHNRPVVWDTDLPFLVTRGRKAQEPYWRLNPVTHLKEPFLPLMERLSRKLASFVVVCLMMGLALGTVEVVILYRFSVIRRLYSHDSLTIRQNAKLFAISTSALVQLIIILILNKIYRRIAIILTNMEQPRTNTEYKSNLTMKIYNFEFVNFYASIFYMAFVKRLFGRWPGSPDYMIDKCDPSGCIIELCIQLAVIMVGNQAWTNYREIFSPALRTWAENDASIESECRESMRWEQDNRLGDMPTFVLFYEYLKMVVQYGFVTIFVAAFPLAPLFAFVNNVMQIRLDAYKFVTHWKRPVAHQADNIGIWYDILKAISFLAVLSNAIIIGWTSDFVPKLVYQLTWSADNSLTGYVHHSLSIFNVSDIRHNSLPNNKKIREFGVVEQCRYLGYYYPPSHKQRYEYTSTYWSLLAWRIIFIICFEHCVFLMSWLVCMLIPDTVHRRRLRELYLTNKALYQCDSAMVYSSADRRRSTRMLEIPLTSSFILHRASKAFIGQSTHMQGLPRDSSSTDDF